MNLALKTAFFERGLRQIEVALRLKMDPSKLSKIIHGWAEPSMDERRAITGLLGKREDELFASKGEKDLTKK